ncbi:MAG: hypothetical protein ABJK25_14090 [Halieaceae bacterium]
MSDEFVVAFVLITIVFVMPLFVYTFSQGINLRGGFLGWPILSIPAFYVAWSAAMNLQNPVQGWDVMGYWGQQAYAFIEHSDASWEKPFQLIWDKHPITLYLVLAWSGWSASITDLGMGAVVPWFMCFLSLMLIVAGFAWQSTRSVISTVIATMSLISLPLLENHTILAGYGEIFVAAAIVGGCALISIGITQSSRTFLVFGLFLLLCLPYIKNTGLAYAMPPIVAYAFVAIFFYSRRVFLGIAIAAIAFLAAIWQTGISVDLGILSIAFDSEQRIINFGGRELELNSVGTNELFLTEITSRVLNQSYHLGLSLFLLSCALLPLVSRQDRRFQSSYIFILLSCALLILMLWLSLFTDDGLRHALPGADTGHSRLSIPVFTLISLLLVKTLEAMSNKIVGPVTDN